MFVPANFFGSSFSLFILLPCGNIELLYSADLRLIWVAVLCLLQVHRLVVVDENEVVKGIVSLSDILQALVLTDGEEGE